MLQPKPFLTDSLQLQFASGHVVTVMIVPCQGMLSKHLGLAKEWDDIKTGTSTGLKSKTRRAAAANVIWKETQMQKSIVANLSTHTAFFFPGAYEKELKPETVAKLIFPVHHQQSQLFNSTCVQLRGFKAKPELNGRRGVVVRFIASTGRYHVQLDEGAEEFNLKAVNLCAC